MRRMIFKALISLSLIAALQFLSCSSQQEEHMSSGKSKTPAEVADAQTVQLAISGMTCQGCANSIDKALAETEGVLNRHVSLADSLAEVKYDPAKTDQESLILAIRESGYDARLSQ